MKIFTDGDAIIMNNKSDDYKVVLRTANKAI